MGNAFRHFLKIWLGIGKAQTQTTAAEQSVLLKYAAHAACIIEIGVFQGVNTAEMAKAMPAGGILLGIDPFFTGRLGISWNEKITGLQLARAGVLQKVRLIKALSEDAAGLITETPDFIFVDGDHSWKGIDSDWKLYSRMLEPGGFIAMHDTSAPPHQAWKASMDSVSYFNKVISTAAGFRLVETVDSLNVLQKL